MNYEINQAVCQSKDSETVVKFLHEGDFTESFENMINQGQIWGVYYDENNNIVAQDIWGDVHENILS